jgi:hypothetical protein
MEASAGPELPATLIPMDFTSSYSVITLLSLLKTFLPVYSLAWNGASIHCRRDRLHVA